jgi:hypothetical protein
MTEDDEYEHMELHITAEDEVRCLLHRAFDDENRLCRTDVLIAVLTDELRNLDDVEDVADVIDAIGAMMIERAMSDMRMFDTVGSA